MNRIAVGISVAVFSAGAVFGADKKAEAVLCADFYADRYGVPRELVHAIIEVESGWRPYAVSEKGAAGLMQLMPATAVAFGVANRFRIEENVEAGVAYLAWLRKRFHGDLRLVTAAYFAGESRVSQQNLSYCSPEVYRYVSRVARVYWGKRSRAIHGEQSRGGAS